MTLNEIFKNTTYDGTLFSEESKAYVESKISHKTIRGSEVPYRLLWYNIHRISGKP